LLLKSGTIVDATIIAAPPSTKNADKQRDPEMKQTRKGNQWYFGMKVHLGTDRRGLVHSVVTGDAAEADITRLDELLHGRESELFGDRAYWSQDHRLHCRYAGIRYRINRRAKPGQALTEHQRWVNRSRSRTRARVEHAFHVVKPNHFESCGYSISPFTLTNPSHGRLCRASLDDINAVHAQYAPLDYRHLEDVEGEIAQRCGCLAHRLAVDVRVD
jgi:IS5 family transposase